MPVTLSIVFVAAPEPVLVVMTRGEQEMCEFCA